MINFLRAVSLVAFLNLLAGGLVFGSTDSIKKTTQEPSVTSSNEANTRKKLTSDDGILGKTVLVGEILNTANGVKRMFHSVVILKKAFSGDLDAKLKIKKVIMPYEIKRLDRVLNWALRIKHSDISNHEKNLKDLLLSFHKHKRLIENHHKFIESRLNLLRQSYQKNCPEINFSQLEQNVIKQIEVL